MMERVKTILLVLLVVTSILLTWQNWVYQPEYDYISPTEYVEREGLALSKEASELLQPRMLVFHYGANEDGDGEEAGEEVHTATYPDTTRYHHMMEQMKSWNFDQMQVLDPNQHKERQEQIQAQQGIELFFSTAIPFHSLQDLFEVDVDEEEKLPAINRISIFMEENEEIAAAFISEQEQMIINARPGISISELHSYLEIGENSINYAAHVLTFPHPEEVYRVHYLPTEPTEMTGYRYFYQQLPIEAMIDYLFIDQTLVREIDDAGRGRFYTDGSRGLQYHPNEFSMYYFHPISDHLQDTNSSDHYVQRSIQFINQHQGWEDDYALYEIEHSELDQQVRVEFRKYLRSYPIFPAHPEVDENIIQLEVQHERVVGYLRPLIEMDQAIDQFSRELPSGTDLVQHLEEERIRLSDVKQISLGYRSEPSSQYVSYVPFWVIELTKGERLFIHQFELESAGGQDDELE